MDSGSGTGDASATVDDDIDTPHETGRRVTPVSTFFAETPPDVESWLQRRRDLGLDGRDEIWEGVLHVAPLEHRRNTRAAQRLARLLQGAADAAGLEVTGPFNLGQATDFRVPDMGLVRRDDADELYNDSAAIVIETLSPHDETFAKFGFYAAHAVQELWVLDVLARTIRIWQLGAQRDGEYAETGHSDLLGLDAVSVQAQLDWPVG
ncbi:Putative restriction endonuclease [Quadrisphaera granulorum]|uniref:Putative restriction endonuclease n=1 Tax=Quadrisphaera granulorum TaxID=317664 RepID=A0A316AH54_9ACTN|nr:Uma2 family endonuclease [Quadrisphaera granulorum]PWJ56234.1 putative restriction endonuclease [Quadrisphaera granulorum]SZE94868.1 Putative restriction endonuclease [Quadrisphaera granulorum]